MSRYNDDGYDDPRRYHTVHTRHREPGEPDYVREETYIERGKGPGPAPRDLVYRGREDSIEDIDREFPPPSGRDYRGYDDRPRRARSARGRYDDYDDDRYSDYGAAGAGAAAGYAAGRHGERRRRRRRDSRDRSDYSESPPRSRERRKSGVGEVLGGLGLGGLAAAMLGKDKDKKDDDRSVRSRSRPGTSRAGRSYRSEGDRSPDRGSKKDPNKSTKQWTQAAQAAIIAGAVEAFRSRKEPGPWSGERGKRIATAAIGAGGIDRLIDRNPNEKTKRHLAEAVVGGLVANRLANGARSKSRGRDRAGSPDTAAGSRRSRSRSIIDRFRGRSASRGPDGELKQGNSGNGKGIKEMVAGGALAAAGAALYDRVRSKSRSRRERSRSSSRDSYVPSRARQRDLKRGRRSPNNSAGFGAAAGTRQMTRRGIDRGPATRGATNGNNDRAIAAGAGGGAAALGARSEKGNDKGSNSGSESSSTTSMENKQKKMRGKELITAGLATVATIHAAHGVYSSMKGHEKRHKLVAEGEMTPEEARKKQTKAWVQDAAAIGIAALGIKGAFSEWREMNEHRKEIHEIEKRKREKRKRIKQRKSIAEAEHRERMMALMESNPQGAAMMMQQDYMNGFNTMQPAQYGAYLSKMQNGGRPPVEQSGNPYAPRAGT